MIRIRHHLLPSLCIAATCLMAGAGPTTAQDSAATSNRQLIADSSQLTDVVAKFVEFVQQHKSYPDAAKTFIADEWRKRRELPAQRTLIPEALAVLHPRFQRGLEAYEARQYGYCAKIMGELSLSPNPYLAGYAALFQAKSLVQEVQLEFASVLLDFYFRDDFDVGQYCLDVDELRFLQGYCLFHTFQAHRAGEALQGFLEVYPGAAPALKAAAKELLNKLEPPPRKNLDQVAHLMADAGLWLTEGQTGVDPQTQQAKALMILEEMIRNAEQQERSQQQQQGSGGGSQSAQGNRSPQMNAAQSTTPAGEATTGPLHDAPRAAPGDVWGQMKPQERARILQVLQENFPSRYRELVEQYYSHLAKEQ